MMPLEVRFMHHPESAHGFVCAALNGCVWHVFKDDNDEWQFERVIKIESIPVNDWILPIMPALTTDLVISPDDKFLYISNWLHGDIRQYDITDPSNPKLVGQLYLGGSLRQDGGVK
jgi:selenium-binding protein 1